MLPRVSGCVHPVISTRAVLLALHSCLVGIGPARERRQNGPGIQLQRSAGHPLCSRLSKPTLYRALARLVERQVIKREGGERSGCYRVVEKAFSHLT